MKKLFTWLLLLPALAAAQIPATEYRYKFDKPLYRVLLNEGVMRESPQTGSDILTTVPKDSTVKLLGLYDGYYRAIYQNNIGFLHFRHIDGDYQTFAKGDYAVSRWRNYYDYSNEPNGLIRYGKVKGPAPIRTAPIYSASMIDTLLAGTVVKITEHNGTYWKVYVADTVGFLGKAYLPVVYKSYKEALKTVEPTESDNTKELLRTSKNIEREANRVLKRYRSVT